MTEVVFPGTEAPSVRRVIADFLELSKSRIVLMVLLTTFAGFLLAATGPLNVTLLIHTLVGTALVAAGTNALNQYVERDLDAQMMRTRRRPLPSHRMTPFVALSYASTISLAGIVYLALLVNPWTAVLAAFTLVSYLFVYTPLKQKTWHSTVIGAVPGAIPPMIGWAAVTGRLDAGAWMVFAILFLWQMPHFFAIGWMHRDDYARGGFAILAVDDTEGRASGRQSVLYSAILLPVSLLPWIYGISGASYALGAGLAGAAFLYSSVLFASRRTRNSARSLFFVSILYLPVVMTLLVLDGVR